MKKFIIFMFNDPTSGSTSSKRVIGFLGFLFLAITMILSTYTITEPSKEIIEAVQYITIASLFGSTIDKFAKKTTTNGL